MDKRVLDREEERRRFRVMGFYAPPMKSIEHPDTCEGCSDCTYEPPPLRESVIDKQRR